MDEIHEYESELGLSANFLVSLMNESDWSFVIKLNALIEAACTDSLVALLYAPELRDALSALDLAHPKYGKIALLRTMGSITSQQASVLQEIYQLRNKLAHNVHQVNFSFRAHIAGLDKQQKRNFAARAGHSLREPLNLHGKNYTALEFVVAAPKFSIWLSVSEILACLRLDRKKAAARLESIGLDALRNNPE